MIMTKTWLYQFGPLAVIDHSHRREEYLAMLKQDETIKRIESFLVAGTKSSSYPGVNLHHAIKRWWCWIATVQYAKRETTRQIFSAGETGAEVRAAVCSDVFRLTLQARNSTRKTCKPKDRKAAVELPYSTDALAGIGPPSRSR